MPLPEQLERVMASRIQRNVDEKVYDDLVHNCPPVSPQLIAHLRLRFEKPDKSARPNNPQLGQLLIIQYGVEKVLRYLEQQNDKQSATARKELGR